MFLRSCKSTLRSLVLEAITLNEHYDYERTMLLLVSELTLIECELRGLNVEGQGVKFGQFHKTKPQAYGGLMSELDDERWAMVYLSHGDEYGIKLSVDEGDDMRYWLHQAQLHARRGRLWSHVEDEI
jgi:hypothetical protein